MKTKNVLATAFIAITMLTANAQSNAKWSRNGDNINTGDWVGSTNNEALVFKANGNVFLKGKTNGEVIIKSLDLNSNTGPDGLVLSDGQGRIFRLNFSGNSNQFLTGNGTWVNLPSAPTQLWSTSGNDLFYTSGNVGIGIAPSPIFKLDVIGDVRISNNLFVGGGIITTDQVNASTQIKSLDVKVDNSLAVQGTSSFTGNATFDGNLKNSVLAGNGDRIIVADANGNLKPIGGSGNGGACSYATPWYLGGNSLLGTSAPFNNIGTCNNVPFVFKSNNNESIFIQPNSFVGIGLNNNNPTAALDITDGVGNSGSSHFKIYGDANGYVESDTHLKLVFGIGKVFEIGGASVGNRMLISTAGKVGLGDNSPAAPNSANLNVNVVNNSSNAFEIFNAGFTSITNNNPTAKTVFKVTGDGKTIIGDKTQLQGPHTNALLTVYGKMVANSCYVRAIDWADYVFASDYKVPNLYDIEKYYKENKHLPEIPSEEFIIENGIDIAEMNKLLLKKIEEMTILMVQQQKDIDLLKSKIK